MDARTHLAFPRRKIGAVLVPALIALMALFPTWAEVGMPRAVAAAATVPMSHFESRDNGFGFDYPADWRSVNPSSFAATAGSSALEDILLQTPDDARVLVSVYQLNTRIGDDELPLVKDQLDNVMSAVAGQLGGSITYAQDFRIGPHRGFEYWVQFERDGQAMESRQRNLFVDDRQYVVALETDAAGQTRYAGAVEQLVASFEAPMLGPKGERVVRAEAAQGHTSDYAPQQAGPYFPVGTRVFEVVFALDTRSAGDTLVGRWIADRVEGVTPGYIIDENSVDTEAGRFKGYFSLTATVDFPAGDYALEILLDGQLMRRVSLHVVE
ncbi:MAG: hypothetical protein HY675_06480 [Chloroflexi bacterium]|nr:hypothetical protein [Chloroflexota bacterium]